MSGFIAILVVVGLIFFIRQLINNAKNNFGPAPQNKPAPAPPRNDIEPDILRILERLRDIREKRENLQLANVKLAVLVSRADGHANECEAAEIKSFVLDILGKNADAARKRKFNEAIAECFRVPTDQIPRKITECCNKITDASVSDRLNLLDLLFEVVMSDGSVAGAELDMLEKIAGALHLDHEEYMKRRNKALPLSAYEKTISGAQTDRILGISADMDDEEIRAHLSKMYREWNAKTSVKDEKIRAQAKEMVKLISKKRAELSAKR